MPTPPIDQVDERGLRYLRNALATGSDGHFEGGYDPVGQFGTVILQLIALYDALKPAKKVETARIVCLCGSTRFKETFITTAREEALKGHLVLTLSVFSHADQVDLSVEQKAMLMRVHRQKIDLADEVLFLNVDGYVGAGGIEELDYCHAIDKPVRWLEDPTR